MNPLANEIRPKTLDNFIGQKHLVGENGPIRRLINNKDIVSMIFWGPPGTGKTTLAKIISETVDADFHTLSAVTQGKADLKKILEIAAKNKKTDITTILFIDEIHRWNKAQQDALLPYIERGDLVLIGATTENPSFTVISALLSRTRVYIFNQFTEDEIKTGIDRTLKYVNKEIDKNAEEFLAQQSNGDLRFAINAIELSGKLSQNKISLKNIQNAIQKVLRYDKLGEEHYNIISAVHKSLRSSNASAAVYWIERMLSAGEDPLYIARRLVRFSSEDIGNANPNALLLANIAYDTCHKIGMPECSVALVQLAKYLADCKKDNSCYIAEKMAQSDIKRYGNLEVPMHFRNAPTQLMKDLGYGEGYIYDHDAEGKKSGQQCMPDKLKGKKYFK